MKGKGHHSSLTFRKLASDAYSSHDHSPMIRGLEIGPDNGTRLTWHAEQRASLLANEYGQSQR